MASSRLDMPSTMIVLDKNSSPTQSNRDAMGDGHNRLSRSRADRRLSDLNPESTRRTPTPSKQVSLTSVRRKEDVDDDLPERCYTPPLDSSKRLNGFYGDVHAVSTRLNQSSRDLATPGPYVPDNAPETNNQSQRSKQDVSNTKDFSKNVNNIDKVGEVNDSDEEDNAPNQLLMEFLGCVMDEDYQNAQKLCKMILLFEPEHPEALKFQPLIEEKLKQEEEDIENSDDDTSSDDDDDSSEDSSQSSSEEEDEENESNQSKKDN